VKLVTYSAGKRAPAKIGVVAPDGSIIDLEAAAKKARVKLPFAADDMIGRADIGIRGGMVRHAEHTELLGAATDADERLDGPGCSHDRLGSLPIPVAK